MCACACACALLIYLRVRGGGARDKGEVGTVDIAVEFHLDSLLPSSRRDESCVRMCVCVYASACVRACVCRFIREACPRRAHRGVPLPHALALFTCTLFHVHTHTCHILLCEGSPLSSLSPPSSSPPSSLLSSVLSSVLSPFPPQYGACPVCVGVHRMGSVIVQR